jgi:hypothetical protein
MHELDDIVIRFVGRSQSHSSANRAMAQQLMQKRMEDEAKQFQTMQKGMRRRCIDCRRHRRYLAVRGRQRQLCRA